MPGPQDTGRGFSKNNAAGGWWQQGRGVYGGRLCGRWALAASVSEQKCSPDSQLKFITILPMQNAPKRLKTERDAREPAEELSFEKYGQHLKNQLDQLSKLLAHRPKNKRDVVHTEPQEEPLPPKRNERIAEESQRPASKSNYTPPASCPAKESERERRRREVYDSELVEDERGEGGEGESGWLASRENSPVKSPYSETMSTASSYSNKLKPNPTGPQLSIADFAVGQLLGSGKFGEVFVAQHRRTGFLCALKVVSRKLIDAKYLPQLVREVKIQSFLNHPNIVRLYGYFLDAKNFYLLQELCCSGQLYALLKRRRRLPEQSARGVIQQLCGALDYMHAYEIIHRDLKPQNIIYQHGMAKLCDFGWSVSSRLMRETFCGTPLYVSPELLKRRNYNNKVDVWSVGVLTYELLFGRVPFEIASERDFFKIVEEEIKFSRAVAVSEEAKDFIMVCLKKDPRDRYTVPELLEHPFLAVEGAAISELF